MTTGLLDKNNKIISQSSTAKNDDILENNLSKIIPIGHTTPKLLSNELSIAKNENVLQDLPSVVGVVENDNIEDSFGQLFNLLLFTSLDRETENSNTKMMSG